MAFCILRFAKIKSRADLRMALQHDKRERVPIHADPERAQANKLGTRSSEESMAIFSSKLPPKHRKDAVLAIETVIALSPKAWSDRPQGERVKLAENYLLDSLGWLEKQMGGPGNILSGVIHWDERTPHAHAIYMPLVDGKLNAKALIGGKKDRLRELQDQFYEEVGKKYGLERGLPAVQTHARHVSSRKFHDEAEKVLREKELHEARVRGGVEKLYKDRKDQDIER